MKPLPASLLLAPLLLVGSVGTYAASRAHPGLGDAATALQPSSGAVDSPALEASLATVEAREIRSDLFFLASDELGGRDSPSPELKIAARFIAARLERLGFTPGAPNGWFYEYPLDFAAIDPDETKITVTTPTGEVITTWRYGKDYFGFLRLNETLDVEGTAVFVGAESEEAFENPALEGRWAITLVTGRKEDPKYRSVRGWAKSAGAIGVLRVQAPGVEDDLAARFGTQVRRSIQGSLTYPSPESDRARSTVEPSVPFEQVTTAALERAVAGLGGIAALEPGSVLPFTVHEARRTSPLGESVTLENVCGFWPGSDPELANEVIVITAHYDHVGRRGDGESGEVVYNGADDNGSGTSGLLAVAEGLAARGPLKRSVLLMWVSAEEKGLFGSEAWTKKPWLPGEARPICDLNIDMIGRNAPDYLLITPSRDHDAYSGLTRLAERCAALEGFPSLGSADAYWKRSDQVNFSENLDLPVAFLFSDVHEDYHQPTDDPEKIDYDKIRRVSRLVLRMLDGLQEQVLDL